MEKKKKMEEKKLEEKKMGSPCNGVWAGLKKKSAKVLSNSEHSHSFWLSLKAPSYIEHPSLFAVSLLKVLHKSTYTPVLAFRRSTQICKQGKNPGP